MLFAVSSFSGKHGFLFSKKCFLCKGEVPARYSASVKKDRTLLFLKKLKLQVSTFAYYTSRSLFLPVFFKIQN